MSRTASWSGLCDGRLERRLFAAVLIYSACVSNLPAHDMTARKFWWGFTSVQGMPQFVGIWQDLNEITLMYTGDRWCSTRARLTSDNTFKQINSSCAHMGRQFTTIKLSSSGDRLKYQILDATNQQPRETGYLLPVN